MKLRFLSIICVFVSMPIFLLSQQNMEFTLAKTNGENKTVYFNVQGLGEDDAEREQLLENLLKDSNILEGRIYTSSSYKTKCQLLLPPNITPEYIRSIINTYGYDYDFTSVSVNGKLKQTSESEVFQSEITVPTIGFPMKQFSGDKQQDEENYQVEKEKWISENERKYKKQKSSGTAEYPIIISKADFEKYTDEKKARLLSEPAKYIIK